MNKKYILSLDGGGVRTIATIVFLQKLEAHLEVSLAEKFDFYIGTSAGAISCLGLAINKMSAKELMRIWSKENLNRTMTNSSWETNLGIMQIKPKYTNEGKREVLTEFFAKKKIGEAFKPIAATSYDIEKRMPVLLTSYGDAETLVVDVGDATSAAPVYYPTAEVGERFLIDGGIVANHPVLHGFVEAKKIYPGSELVVLSVGTGLNKRSLKGKDSTKWGLIGWMMHDLFGLMVESSMDHELAEDLIGENYLRINSALGKVNRRLDDSSDSNIERIISMGESWWDEFGQKTLDLLK
ncbi:MAG: phospholipase [Gammaproteobacteria bacterium]|nr:phospholipase [Gammaproteobacteria bacterium]HJL95766.1 patatin-like phospholipase family protein [SAR86 cluster bacterium]